MSGRGDSAVWMTPAELGDIGRGLYGRYGWQSKLARALDVDPRYVRRWYAGDVRIQRDTAHRIRELARQDGDTGSADRISYQEAVESLADNPAQWSAERDTHGTLCLIHRHPDGTRTVYRDQGDGFRRDYGERLLARPAR